MSSKTVAEKMYIKPGMRIGFFNAPDNLHALMGKLPDDIEIVEDLPGEKLDVVLAFIEDREMLEGYLGSLKNAIHDKGALWLAYYKQSSPESTDINRDSIHKYASELNLKGVAMIAIDDDWAALRCKKI